MACPHPFQPKIMKPFMQEDGIHAHSMIRTSLCHVLCGVAHLLCPLLHTTPELTKDEKLILIFSSAIVISGLS